MTAPLDDDPQRGLPTSTRAMRRELLGLLLVLAGAATLLWVLVSVDWRLAVGLAAAGCIATGLWLGREPDDVEGG